ncbi:MAG TPA: imidazole glycerol phosphate synthase subunit HisH [Myxococcaceae bacterium]|nr:imidazole glycerol phosphate synthase subunit HisH [Myxococcaceae bacterium]
MKIVLFDYQAGNIHSLAKALSLGGAEVTVELDSRRCAEGDALVLPGVGAFAPAAERLAPGREIIRRAVDRGMPCLGICLGMQLFWEESEEGSGRGLGLFPGKVRKLRAGRVPQIGWNALERADDPLFSAAPLEVVYYANSYVCPDPPEGAVAWSEHGGDRFAAAVRCGSAVGVQFHPEKSSAPGVQFIRAFLEEARR